MTAPAELYAVGGGGSEGPRWLGPVPTYRATCTECDTWTAPLSYVEAVGWTVEHANTCPDARTEIHPEAQR